MSSSFVQPHCFSLPSEGEYFAKLIRSLELHAGYKRNKDIFGAQCKFLFLERCPLWTMTVGGKISRTLQ